MSFEYLDSIFPGLFRDPGCDGLGLLYFTDSNISIQGYTSASRGMISYSDGSFSNNFRAFPRKGLEESRVVELNINTKNGSGSGMMTIIDDDDDVELPLETLNSLFTHNIKVRYMTPEGKYIYPDKTIVTRRFTIQEILK